MSAVNLKDTFKRAFDAAKENSPVGKVTFSNIFVEMESLSGGFANVDFVKEQIQAGINSRAIKVCYGVLDADKNIVDTFSKLKNEPDLQDGQSVEPVYF